jgi:transposase
VGNSDRTLRHGHITKQGSPWVRWILQGPPSPPRRARCSPTPTASSLAAGPQYRHRGHRRRLLARSFHILTQLEAAPAPEKVITGRARVFA